MTTHSRKSIMAGDGNPWVSPTLPSSDDHQDATTDMELPTYHDVLEYETGETNGVVQEDDDNLISLEIDSLFSSDNGHLPPQDRSASDHDMIISNGQHVDPPDRNTSWTAQSHDIEQPEDLPGMSSIVTLPYVV